MKEYEIYVVDQNDKVIDHWYTNIAYGDKEYDEDEYNHLHRDDKLESDGTYTRKVFFKQEEI